MPVILALSEAEVGGSWGQEIQTILANTVKPHLYSKIQKTNWARWWAPVVPATWEAEVGESLEPKRRRLQWAEITPPHSSLGDRVRLHLKNKTKIKTESIWINYFNCFGDVVSLCYPGWSAVVWSRLTATSSSWVRVILPCQPPK